jgi:hypothetical protein
MTDDLLAAREQSVPPQRATRHDGRRVEYGLRLVTATALVVDSYMHAHDAGFYDFRNGGAITQGNLFRIEAAIAALVAVVLLVWRRRFVLLVAFAVSASALGAVLLYTYVDVGTLGPVPNMYEPTWTVPGKAITAWAEGVAVVTSAVGVADGYLRRHRTRPRRVTSSAGMSRQRRRRRPRDTPLLLPIVKWCRSQSQKPGKSG